jgi:hypothetical protein
VSGVIVTNILRDNNASSFQMEQIVQLFSYNDVIDHVSPNLPRWHP